MEWHQDPSFLLGKRNVMQLGTFSGSFIRSNAKLMETHFARCVIYVKHSYCLNNGEVSIKPFYVTKILLNTNDSQNVNFCKDRQKVLTFGGFFKC